MHKSDTKFGFTLIEAVMVVAISTMLLLVISYAIVNLYRLNSYSFAQSNEVENARRGITQWNRDAKEMTTAEDGTFPVAVIDEHHFGDSSPIAQ